MMVRMDRKSKSIDLIVLGAGAGGLTAAAVAATEGLEVLVLEIMLVSRVLLPIQPL